MENLSLVQRIGWGGGLIAALYLLYLVKPRAGASAALMLAIGVIIWQANNKKGFFYVSE